MVSPVIRDVLNPPNSTLLGMLQQGARDVIDGKRFFDQYADDALYMRVLLTLGAMQDYFREERLSRKGPLLVELRRITNDFNESSLQDPQVRAFLDASVREMEIGNTEEMVQRSGWQTEVLPPTVSQIPTMLCDETLVYYHWLARTFKAPGDIVELGCWMGSSTSCLAEGLLRNPSRNARKLHVCLA
jgi:hypothetical protein